MTGDFLIRLAAIAGVGVVGLGTGIMVILQAQRRQQQIRERIASVVDRPAADVPKVVGEMAVMAGPTRSRTFVKILTRSGRRRPDEMAMLWIILILGIAIAAGVTAYFHDFLGNVAFLILPALPIFLTRFVFGWRDKRLENAYRRQFPEVLAMVARTVRVGVPVAEALRIVARESEDPTAAEYTYLNNRIAIGIPIGEALHSSAERTGLAEHRLFATAVSLQSQTGGGLTETLTNLSVTIRKRIAARQRAHAMASEARTTAYILGGLPIVTGGILAVVNPTYVSVLVTDKTGNLILACALASLMTGFFIMRFIIQKSLT